MYSGFLWGTLNQIKYFSAVSYYLLIFLKRIVHSFSLIVGSRTYVKKGLKKT